METSKGSCDSTDQSSVCISVEAERTVSSNGNKDSNEINSQEHKSKTNTEDEINKSSDALAKGLSTMLANVIRDFDSKAQETLKSQDQLNSAIDRLTRDEFFIGFGWVLELDQLLEDAPLPFIMQHAAKISGVKKRVSSLNSLLKSIQRRIDNMDRMLSVGVLQEKTHSGSS
ncbi:uncharacterized protein LOC105646226 isoform X1 [Jatropha curcas]|uniref:uncharacterized protein LOC105646226 isoform X1 n=1 Tax=Jatropha curcas TaxID=180498 RepID=UPI001892F438|nr:uncharacterized protein LOC105646226 isoform X1 [Jatropha curcas]XP_037495780.1 uncharacterized protein LOC105646226 isoform X1 [Jatropha curcas]